jgi:homocysteine S-methyltransferase
MTTAKYRNRLPQLNGTVMLSDGGMETTMVFHNKIDLPFFSAAHLLRIENGEQIICDYFKPYIEIALASKRGLILGTPTWRASPDWAAAMNYTPAEMEETHRRAVALLAEIRNAHETRSSPFLISGDIGPRGDGYVPGAQMTADEATDYHLPQMQLFASTEADMVTALTLNYVEEAIGIARAAAAAAMPVAISFTLETDGRLPTGQSLADAVMQVDAETKVAPAYYMINCAHPTHFADAVANGEPWTSRIKGLRANASCMSHAELEACTELDVGNPVELGGQYRALQVSLPGLSVFGGCCGTDHRHIAEISRQIAA